MIAALATRYAILSNGVNVSYRLIGDMSGHHIKNAANNKISNITACASLDDSKKSKITGKLNRENNTLTNNNATNCFVNRLNTALTPFKLMNFSHNPAGIPLIINMGKTRYKKSICTI